MNMFRSYSTTFNNYRNSINKFTKHCILRARPLKSRISPVYPARNLSTFAMAAKHIVWVDLEMTGLDINIDKILEIACIVTDADLNIVATGPDLIVHQPDEVLDSMCSWCKIQHGESGLTEASRNSNISLEEAEDQVVKFLRKHVPENRCPLGGNSVWMDRVFIMKYMPTLNSYLHYRIIDVTSIKELAKRWYRNDFSKMPTKKFKHRALDDILETINELKHYKENIFKLI